METSSSTSESTAATGTGYPMSQEETKPTSKQSLYADIGKLPFHVYVDAVCGAIQLDNFDDLQGQFNDAVGHASGIDFSAYAEIEALNIKYEVIQNIIALLAIESSDDVWEWAKEELSLLGFDMCDNDLGKLAAKVEVIKLEIAEKMESLPAQSESAAPTRQQYVELVARIARHFKLPLYFDAIMTAELCAHYKAYVEEANRQQPANEDD